MSHGPASKWLTDIGLALGLVGALAVVAVVEPRPEPPAPPAEFAIAAVSPSAEGEIPPLPPMEFAFVSTVADKELPPLPPPPPPPPPPAAPPAPPPLFEDKIDTTKILNIGFRRGRSTFGPVRLGPTEEQDQRLIFNEFGDTNHVAVGVDGKTVPFFSRLGRVIKDFETAGVGEANASDKTGMQKIPVARLADGAVSLQWEYGGVRFEQWTDFEAGAVSRKMDTLRVRYTLTNVDTRPHKAGLRVMIDTLIGKNDGVPFFIPGRKEVVDKPAEFKGQAVPDYLLALERNDLNDPTMTVIQIGLAPPPNSGSERPAEVAVARWPGNRALVNPANPDAAVSWLDNKWIIPKGTAFGGDSALVLTYQPAEIAANGKRVFEFTYGLGSLSSQNPELSLVPYGPFLPGQPFRVSAFVKNAKAGQTVALNLPQGLALDKDETAEKPVEVQAGVTVTKVDWLVTPSAEFGGKAELQATLTGAAKPAKQTIFVPNPRPALQPITIGGKPAAGGIVRVTIAVFNVKAGTTTTLELPAGATLESGSTAAQSLTPGAVAQATWLVRLPIDAKGNLPVTVKMANPDASVASVIAIPPIVPKLAALHVNGLKQAGGTMRVTAQVANADASGSIDLKLPSGIVLAAGQTSVQPTPAARLKQVSWIVRANPGTIGEAAIVVRLLPTGEELTEKVELAPATPILTAQLAKNAPVTPGRPTWIVARVQNPSDALKATLVLPAGWSIAGGGAVEVVMEKKTADGVVYTQAAWPVVLDSYSYSKAELKVTVPGVGAQTVEVKCERGSVIR